MKMRHLLPLAWVILAAAVAGCGRHPATSGKIIERAQPKATQTPDPDRLRPDDTLRLESPTDRAMKNVLSQSIRDFAKDPTNAYTFLKRGKEFLKIGNYDQAVADFSQAIELLPDFAEAYVNRAKAYKALGMFQQALADYNKNIQLNPGTDAYAYRGMLFDMLQDFERARADFTKAREIDPKTAYAYNNRGDPYLISLKLALEFDPYNSEIYFSMAQCYEEVGRIPEAINAYKKVVEFATPDDILLWEKAMDKVKELEKP